jgi:hypothetical protein
MNKTSILLLAGLCAANLAQAQSHSVANYSNPPGTSAASSAAIEATPSLSATADSQDVYHAGKAQADARANRARHAKGARKTASPKANTASAKAPVERDGASKGGAEAALQPEPSVRSVGDVERHAFDKTPLNK